MRMFSTEDENEGLAAFAGKSVTLYCANFIYWGVLVGINEADVKLKDPYIVYNTGPHEEPHWSDAAKMPHDVWYVRKGAIESYGHFKDMVKGK